MTETNDQKVNRFTTYFEEQLQEISQINSPGEHVNLYKRVLYVSVLDALAKVAFPNSGTGKRMVNLLIHYSDWKECNRLSLPHLVKLLKLAPEPAFEKLRLYAIKKLDNWESGNVITLDRDPSDQVIKKLWPSDKEYKFQTNSSKKEISLESVQHGRLFYVHRNSLVHEFRMPGLLSGAPMHSKDVPYYSTVINGFDKTGRKVTSWELNYPLRFYEQITKNCLVNLSKYLRRNQIDPFSVFTQGSYWIEEWNA